MLSRSTSLLRQRLWLILLVLHLIWAWPILNLAQAQRGETSTRVTSQQAITKVTILIIVTKNDGTTRISGATVTFPGSNINRRQTDEKGECRVVVEKLSRKIQFEVTGRGYKKTPGILDPAKVRNYEITETVMLQPEVIPEGEDTGNNTLANTLKELNKILPAVERIQKDIKGLQALREDLQRLVLLFFGALLTGMLLIGIVVILWVRRPIPSYTRAGIPFLRKLFRWFHSPREKDSFPLLSVSDIRNWEGFCLKLVREAGKSEWNPGGKIAKFLTDEEPRALTILNQGARTAEDKQIIVRVLNNIMKRPDLCEEKYFESVPKPDEAKRLLGRKQEGSLSKEETIRLNRLLLEAAFPEHIVKSQVFQGQADTQTRRVFDEGLQQKELLQIVTDLRQVFTTLNGIQSQQKTTDERIANIEKVVMTLMPLGSQVQESCQPSQLSPEPLRRLSVPPQPEGPSYGVVSAPALRDEARAAYRKLIDRDPALPKPIYLNTEEKSSRSDWGGEKIYLQEVNSIQGALVLFADSHRQKGWVFPNPHIVFHEAALRRVFPNLTEDGFNRDKERVEPVRVSRETDGRWKVEPDGE